jgi:hypothetical protein
MHTTFRVDSFRLIAGLVLACAGALAASPAARADDGDDLHAAALPRSAVLSSVRTAYADGDRIGSVHAGADCRNGDERTWTPLVRQRMEAEVTRVFREETAKAVAMQPAAAKAAPLRVHAFINDLNVAVCQAGAGAWQGGFRVQVGWQIVAPESGKVIYQASTDGSFALAEPQRMSSAEALHRAFGAAVRSLLTDRRFTAMLQEHESRRLALARLSI